MKKSSRRTRLARLAAGGLLLSGLLPVAAAEPVDLPPPPIAVPGPCPQEPARVSCWEAFWSHFRAPCATIRPGSIPAPNGAAVHTWDGLMAQRAAADEFVIYNHEWYMGGALLGPYGCAHVRRIAALLPREPYLLVVQPECSPELNESRRSLLIFLLQSEGVADAERRVVVTYPTAEGMWGDEAARIYNRGYGGAGGSGASGINAGFGNPLQPSPGGLTPSFSGFQGGFRGGLSGGYSGF